MLEYANPTRILHWLQAEALPAGCARVVGSASEGDVSLYPKI
jgi:hypothetical protein